jgi:hypothetical protein
MIDQTGDIRVEVKSQNEFTLSNDDNLPSSMPRAVISLAQIETLELAREIHTLSEK